MTLFFSFVLDLHSSWFGNYPFSFLPFHIASKMAPWRYGTLKNVSGTFKGSEQHNVLGKKAAVGWSEVLILPSPTLCPLFYQERSMGVEEAFCPGAIFSRRHGQNHSKLIYRAYKRKPEQGKRWNNCLPGRVTRCPSVPRTGDLVFLA